MLVTAARPAMLFSLGGVGVFGFRWVWGRGLWVWELYISFLAFCLARDEARGSDEPDVSFTTRSS